MTTYNAAALLSIESFWGEDITPEQAAWLADEVNSLPEAEFYKFQDAHLEDV